MQDEVSAAALVLARIIGHLKNLTNEKVHVLSKALESVMKNTFNNHWYKEEPLRGQGFRCIRVNGTTPVHPILLKAAEAAGLRASELKLPSEVSIWVDPNFVVCRFGQDVETERRVLWLTDSGRIENRADTLDLSDLLSSTQHPFFSTKQTPVGHYEEEDMKVNAPSGRGLPQPRIDQNTLTASPHPVNEDCSSVHLGPHSNSFPGMHHSSVNSFGSPLGRFPRGGIPNHRTFRHPSDNSSPEADRFNGWQAGKSNKFNSMPMPSRGQLNGSRHPPPQHPPWLHSKGEMVQA